MNLAYSPFDPGIWVIFGLFATATFLIVKIYHWKHPNYPEGEDKDTSSKP